MQSPGRWMRLGVVLLPVLAAVSLAACGSDMHDVHGNQSDASASLALQATVSAIAADGAGSGPAAAPEARTRLQLSDGLALTGFRLGLRRVMLRPMGGAGTAIDPIGDHVADLLGDPAGHTMGPAIVHGRQAYQVDMDLWPMPGVDPGDPEGAWAMVMELTYADPAGDFTHTFVLRWNGPAEFHMDGANGLMMGEGEHGLILAFRTEQILETPYDGRTILDALLATPMEPRGLHVLNAAEHPDLFAAILAAVHDAMVFGEDMNHDGHLHDGDDPMVGHHGAGGMM